MGSEQRPDLATNTHLLGKPALRRVTGPRMTAAGVGPQPAGMIFCRIAAVHQHVTRPVAHQYGKRPVFQPTPVHLDLRRDALRYVICIDKDDRIAIVGSGRKPVQFRSPTNPAGSYLSMP